MIRRFKATDFRCLEEVDLALNPKFNLVFGVNASGKTSLLEALAYLGRGKSFRGALTSDLVRHGATEFVLFGEAEHGGRTAAVGARNGRAGLEVRIDGASAAGSAALAEVLPLQVIDPEVHNLVAGGPDGRRRFLDWIAFHVEREHLATWRRFKRVLKQRNAALKARASKDEIAGWDKEFAACGDALDRSRRAALEVALEDLRAQGKALLDTDLGFDYRQGWSSEKGLSESLANGLDRDLQYGSTQSGPHRADLKVSYDERLAKKLVSRGQQKLLASAMILAATQSAQAALEQPMLLLLDDPAAELDVDSLGRLMTAVGGLDCQVVATSLDPAALEAPEGAAVFHVEQGKVSAL